MASSVYLGPSVGAGASVPAGWSWTTGALTGPANSTIEVDSVTADAATFAGVNIPITASTQSSNGLVTLQAQATDAMDPAWPIISLSSPRVAPDGFVATTFAVGDQGDIAALIANDYLYDNVVGFVPFIAVSGQNKFGPTFIQAGTDPDDPRVMQITYDIGLGMPADSIGIGSYTTHDLVLFTDSTLALTLSKTDQAATFTGVVKAAGYKSSDGTAGATVTTCSAFKNGLCVSGT